MLIFRLDRKWLSGCDVIYTVRPVHLRQPIHDNQPKNSHYSSLDIYIIYIIINTLYFVG